MKQEEIFYLKEHHAQNKHIMKKIIYTLLTLTLLSCSSTNIERQILSDFLEVEYKKFPSTNVILDKAYPRTKSLDYYIMAYEDRNIRMGDWIRISPKGYPPYNWPIDITVAKELKSKYKGDTTYYWKKKDFYKPKFKIISRYELFNRNSSFNKKFFDGHGFAFSKPIVSSNHKYAFLFYSDFSVGLVDTGRVEAVLMENINGKWKIIASYIDPNVHY
jgi:hypothetical protein